MFQGEETFKVISNDGEIGTLDECPEIGKIFTLAGRSWVVVSVDLERKNIYVNRTKNNKIPPWSGNGGDIHTKIVSRMKKVLQEDIVYSYLQPNAQKLLLEARKIARESGILEHDVIQYAEKCYYLCPWIGTRTLGTIASLFNYGLKDEFDICDVKCWEYYLSFVSTLSLKELSEKLSVLKCPTDDVDLVLKKDVVPKNDKYDYMVPDDLLKTAYLNNQTDIETANDVLNNLMW